ncbi:MAG: methyltransferase domain-containing protein [Actinobacteria bacterium]|nr:methyltransferase domain-containing protein [Actinomycetota bacterium]
MSATGSLFGKVFARVAPRMDRRGANTHRQELVRGLSGDVVEVGAGYGATFPFYPPDVRSLLALEPDIGLRNRATRAATATAVPIRVGDGRAENIPLPDNSVDAVVFSLVLCSVQNQATALDEAARVLKPQGTLTFYEHVRSTNRAIGFIEDIATPAWSGLAGHCHPNRETVRSILDAGFHLQTIRRFGFSVLPATPPVAHVIGRAVKFPAAYE